jgi:large conductance mechanosensitive channel
MADEKTPITTQVEVVENKDGSVTVVHPKGRRHSPAITALLESDDVFRDQVGGFANFLREYAVIGLAVGFIVGQQANAVVKQMVASFVDPWTKILFGQDLSTRVAHLHHDQTLVVVPWGLFVYTLIEFFLVLIVLYVLIKLFRLDKLKKPKESK